MRSYERIFGSGPKVSIISITLLIMAYYMEEDLGLGQIVTSEVARYSALIVLSIFGVSLLIWSLKSLSPEDRGRKLVKVGAYKYFRHPLYAAFLLFFNFGIAFLLNNFIYLLWAVILFPIWSLIVKSEEELMRNEFGEEYVAYCRNTWRFVPKLWF